MVENKQKLITVWTEHVFGSDISKIELKMNLLIERIFTFETYCISSTSFAIHVPINREESTLMFLWL